METPLYQIVYLDLDGNWNRYRCRVSGDHQFDLENGDKKCHMIVRDGHAILAKLVSEDGEGLAWWKDGAGKVRRLR